MGIIGKLGLFAAGVVFGSAGFKLLGSQDAKKAYTQVTAAALRCKDEVMKQVENVQENCSDILNDAKTINEARAAEEEAKFTDEAETETKEEPQEEAKEEPKE